MRTACKYTIAREAERSCIVISQQLIWKSVVKFVARPATEHGIRNVRKL